MSVGCLCSLKQDEEQEEEDAVMEETSLADPCTSLASTCVVDTRGSVDPVTSVVGIVQETLDYHGGRSCCGELTPECTSTEIHRPLGASNDEIASGTLDHPSEAENIISVSSGNPTGVLEQPLVLRNLSKASNHTFISTNLLSTASLHPPELMNSLMIESGKHSKALLCPSECSDPPLMEFIDPSEVPPLTTAFACKSKNCLMTYKIASDLAFHYIYQHPELIASDLISGNRKSGKCSIAGNAYAKSLRPSTASKREYSEQTRGLRDPSLVHPCAAMGKYGKYVRHRPKTFPCPKVGCTKKYSCEKRLSNHLHISHRKHVSNPRQLSSSDLRSNSEMDSSIGADYLGVCSSLRSDDGYFFCPKAGCKKKYSSEKRLSNHLWICHREHPANLEEMNSSHLQSDSKIDSSVAVENLEANSPNELDDSKMDCGRSYDLEKIVDQSSSEKESYGKGLTRFLDVMEGSACVFPGVNSSTPVV